MARQYRGPWARKQAAKRKRDILGSIGLALLTAAMVAAWFYTLAAYLESCGAHCTY